MVLSFEPRPESFDRAVREKGRRLRTGSLMAPANDAALNEEETLIYNAASAIISGYTTSCRKGDEIGKEAHLRCMKDLPLPDSEARSDENQHTQVVTP